MGPTRTATGTGAGARPARSPERAGAAAPARARGRRRGRVGLGSLRPRDLVARGGAGPDRRAAAGRDAAPLPAHATALPTAVPARADPDPGRALHLRARAARLSGCRTSSSSPATTTTVIGHLAQGFVPAILAREILLRASPLVRGGWLFFLVTSVCLAFSAFYEMVEWWAAVLGGEDAEALPGHPGRRLGHPVGHVPGAHGGASGAAAAGPSP